MLNIFTIAFFGHRYLNDIMAVEGRLETQIRKLINEHEYVEFLVGRNGDFDQCVSSSVRRVQRNYRDDNSALVLVLPYPTAEYSNNEATFHQYYTNVEISYAASAAYPKSAIQIRNREMADRADLVICYIEQEKGGAWQAVEYARKQGKPIINLA